MTVTNNALRTPEAAARAVAFALTSGLTVARRDGGFTHCPLMVEPSPFPRALFEKAQALSPVFNRLVDDVSRDGDFLREALTATAAADEFTGRLLAIHNAVYPTRGVSPQGLMLGMHRSDYMLHTGGSNDPAAWNLQQVEINTIASSFAGLSPLVNRLHRYTSAVAGKTSEIAALEAAVPVSTSADDLALALASAFAAHARSGRGGDVSNVSGLEGEAGQAVLFVVQEGELNVSDQRILEQNVWLNHKVRCVRHSLQEINARGSVSKETGSLVIDGVECLVAYFRAGYTPTDYPTEGCWEARHLVESSTAVKCPSIPYHLTGTKKVQQLLCDEEVLARFIADDAVRREVMSVFAPMSGLAAGEKTFILEALAHPESWLLKPQREGGGTLVFGDEMTRILGTLTPSQRDEFILMKKITPPVVPSASLRDGTYVAFLNATPLPSPAHPLRCVVLCCVVLCCVVTALNVTHL